MNTNIHTTTSIIFGESSNLSMNITTSSFDTGYAQIEIGNEYAKTSEKYKQHFLAEFSIDDLKEMKQAIEIALRGYSLAKQIESVSVTSQ